MTIHTTYDYPVEGPRKEEPDLWGEADVDGIVRQLAHDLRQPLAAIRALAAAASADVDVSETVLHRLAEITGQASWISAAIDDALKPAAGIRAVVSRQPVSVRALVRAVVDTEQLTYRGHISFHAGSSDDLYLIANAIRLRRAVANVLGNATRAAGPLGEVDASVIADGGLAIVQISDNGPGFGRLGREHGIGLQVTRSVLMETGGWLETERPPGGLTVVRLNLPVADGRSRAGVGCA